MNFMLSCEFICDSIANELNTEYKYISILMSIQFSQINVIFLRFPYTDYICVRWSNQTGLV